MQILRVILAAVILSVLSANASEKPSGLDLSSLPVAAQSKISATLGRDVAEFNVRRIGRGFEAKSRGLDTRFTSTGVQVRNGSSRWGLRLQGYGYGNQVRTVRSVAPKAAKNRVEYRRETMTEWYLNGPMGLEQGFTIKKRLGKAYGQPLTIALETSGNLATTSDNGGAVLILKDASGKEALRYTGLTAYDADGKDLHATINVNGRRLLLQVNDASARYPIVVDPIVQLAKLTTSDGGVLSLSVAISGDVCVAGTLGGAAYVFVKPPSGWTNMKQTAKLTPSVFNSDDLFGESVAISGNIVVVGAPGTNQNQGAAYAYVKPAGGWKDMTETAKLVASDGAAGDKFGVAVAVSGGTAVVGAPLAAVNGNASQGATYIFTKPVADQVSVQRPIFTETAKLTASDGGTQNFFGQAASISGDTVAVGAWAANNGEGAAYVFVKPQSGWTSISETAILRASDGGGFLGVSVCTNGSTVAAGANTDPGKVYVFEKSQTGWSNTFEAAQLVAKKIGWQFGQSVAIDGSGRFVVVGAPQGNGHQNGSGDAFIFVKPPSGWRTTSDYALRVFASDGKDHDTFGYSITLSKDTLVAIGGGAAYVFGSK